MDCPFCQKWTVSATDHVPWSQQAYSTEDPAYYLREENGCIVVVGLETQSVVRNGGSSLEVEQFTELKRVFLTDDNDNIPDRTRLALYDWYPSLAARKSGEARNYYCE